MQVEQLNAPKVGKAELLDQQFGAWWVVLNSIGVFSFGLFLACLGVNEHKHNCAVLSLFLVAWLYGVGRKKFPSFVTKLRSQESEEATVLEKGIWSDHLSFFKSFVTHFPMWLGLSCLGALAIHPVLWGQYDKYLYIFG
jgi:protein-S-isoprenylcysteine O-methyltransferase Ste14